MTFFVLPANPPLDTMHPLNIGTALQDTPFGPFTFCSLRQYLLTSLNLSIAALTPPIDDTPRLHLPANSWLSAESAIFCASTKGAVTFVDSDDHVVAFRCRGEAPLAEAPRVRVPGTARRIRYPWHLLEVVASAAADLSMKLPFPQGLVRDGATIDGELWCGEGTTILPGVFVEGRVFIGKNCKVGPNCYLRGPMFIGDNCRIGQSVEIKASLLMNRTAVGHLSYVGDSVLASRVNFGAGTITANLRHDGSGVRSLVADALIDSGRRKFGAIVGEAVHTGIQTSIYPGRKLSAGAGTRPGEIVSGDVATKES